MAGAVLNEKLESLRRCIQRVRSTCPDSAEALGSDIDAQDIVTLNLTRAIQLAVDIGSHLLSATDQPAPTTMGETFTLLCESGLIDEALADRLRRAVGFRNIAIHSYRDVDWTIVHSICTDRLDDFRDFARIASSLK